MLGFEQTGGRKIAKQIRCSPEQIITKLRETEVLPSQGQTVGQVCRTNV